MSSPVVPRVRPRSEASPRRAGTLAAAMLALMALVAPTARAERSIGDEAYDYLLGYTDSFKLANAWYDNPRTGTPGGNAAHHWIESQIQSFGMPTWRETWTFPRFALRDWSLTVHGTGDAPDFSPASYPWFYEGATGPEGVTGELVYLRSGNPVGAAQTNGKIVLVDGLSIANNTTSLPAGIRSGAKAVIVAIDGPGNSIVGTNTRNGDMGATPTLIIGKLDARKLAGMVGRQATVVVNAAIDPQGEARNTFGMIPGKDPTNIVLVGTPANGLHNVATERGGGVAGMLTLARTWAERARTNPPPYTMVFVAMGGHEVSSSGLDELLKGFCNRELVAYIHFGAGLASWHYVDVDGQVVKTGIPEWFRGIWVSENPLLLQATVKAFGPDLTEDPQGPADPGAGQLGEGRVAYAAGIPTIANAGVGAYHHAVEDTPDKVAPEILGPPVQGFIEVVDQLMAMDADDVRTANTAATGRRSTGGTCFSETHP